MKTRNLFLLVPLAALAVGYFAWAPGYSTDSNDTSGPVAGDASVVTWSAFPANPFTVPAHPVVGECEIATHYVANGDGTVSDVYSCIRSFADSGHPYESYSNAALESLAYADAKAAEVLGMRLRESDEAKAMSLILRASALAGGDRAPILLYSNAYPGAMAIDAVPVRKTVHLKFVLSAVVDLMNTETNYAAAWEDRIREYSADPDTEIAMLYDRALKIVAEMRQIQIEVTGDSTIGGLGDA